MIRITNLLICILISSSLLADEGMWMLNDLKESTWSKMRELGFSLTQEQLYDTIQPSLKDAVIYFGSGCTGITVSEKGLIFTNHHCGYGAIQSQSTVEHDYLRDGFVAQAMEEELPIPGLFVKYLIKTIDVTGEMLKDIAPDMDEKVRLDTISARMERFEKFYADKSQSIEATVNPYFSANRFYINIYEVMTDVRLVFAPPTSVGKFGGETDNWMWPRHTGDFSIFRVYVNPEKKQGHYKDNIPYTPRYVAPVSLNGYYEDSYAMTIGYPGRTNRYLSSWGIRQRVENQNKPRIEVRGIKQNIWKEAMLQSDAIRIKYAAKYAVSSNYWKNSIGMNRGVEKMHVVERKIALEQEFENWLQSHPEKNTVYGQALGLLKTGYTQTDGLQGIRTYLMEAFSGAEIVRLANRVSDLDFEDEDWGEDSEILFSLYKDYESALDERVLAAMLKIVAERVPSDRLPDVYEEISGKYKNDYSKYAANIFKKSVIPYPEVLKAILLNPKKRKNLEKDPAIRLAQSVNKIQDKIQEAIGKYRYNIIEGERLFMAGLQEMKPDIDYPSDANSTLRMSYGTVGGYEPFDGAYYDYFTTTKGVFEKYNKDDPEFNVQPEILEMLRKKDFGRYGNSIGDMNVNFLSNNDITGGNSGSPVFDEKGRVIGLAFDGNWEAMSGDIAFEPDVQKCIGVDIRYVLYMIDKWGNCQRLLDELIIE